MRRAGRRPGLLHAPPRVTGYLLDALRVVAERGPIGRRKLAEAMETTAYGARLLLLGLEAEGLARSTARGHVVTPAGRSVVANAGQR